MKTFLKPTSYPNALAYSLSFNALSKGLVFLVNFLIAFYFGANNGTDVYFFCFTAILLFVNFISNMSASVIIPEAILIERKEGFIAFVGFINRYFCYLVFLLIAISAFFYWDPVFIVSKVSKFDLTTIEDNKAVIMLSVPALVLQCISFFLNDLLTSRRYFTIPMVVSGINAAVVILFVILGHDQLGIPSVMWGNILGFSLALILQIYILHKLIKWDFLHIGNLFRMQVWRNLSFTNLGYVATIFSSFLPIYLLSDYANGYITSLVFGLRIAEIPNTMVSMQLASVVSIRFSESFAKDQLEDMNEVFLRSARFLTFLLIPISVVGSTQSKEISYIIFGYGVLDKASLDTISDFLRILIIACPFIGINIIASRILMATQKIRASFYYQVILNVALSLIIVASIRVLGPLGYAYGYTTFYILNFVALFVFLRKTVSFIRYKQLFSYFLLIYTVSASLIIGPMITSEFLDMQSGFMRLAYVTVTYLLLLLLANRLFRLNHDIHNFLNEIKNKVS